MKIFWWIAALFLGLCAIYEATAGNYILAGIDALGTLAAFFNVNID